MMKNDFNLIDKVIDSIRSDILADDMDALEMLAGLLDKLPESALRDYLAGNT